MAKLSKKNMNNFLKTTERILLDSNFKRTITTDKFNPMYEWVKETKDFGKVYFNPDNSTDTNIYSIFGRFEDVEKVKNFGINNGKNLIDIFDINPYSGKCNFHYKELEAVLYMFIRLLSYINQYQPIINNQ